MDEGSEFWYLENVDVFKFICPGKMEAAGAEFHEQYTFEFKKGEFIYFPNEPSQQVFLLFSGRVKIGTYSQGGKEIIKAILQPGELFGEMAIIGEEKRREYAMAMDDLVRVCIMGLKELKALMYTDVEFSLKITRMLGLKLLRTERRLESLVFKDARTRIVDFLRNLGIEKGRKVGDETLVANFFTHRDIASLTATSRQTVTSVLNELREQNLIYFDRKRLLIRDMDKLH